MIPLKAVFVISVLISGLIFSPSYSFAQSTQDENPLASFFEAFMKLFSFDDEPSEPVIQFEDVVVVQSSSSTPIANAGGNQTVMQFEKVFLDGSSSTDPDGGPISFQWNQTEGPLVDLSNATAVNPMFNATTYGVLKFMLTVVDTSNLTDTDSVTISVNKKDVPDNGDPDNDKDQNKVTICHIPPGNPENAHTITVGESAVLAHVAQHGDTIGPCSSGVQDEKSNSGKGNNDSENKPDNSGKGNSGVDNSGKGNSDNDENEKSNSGKGNSDKDKNEKSNSGKGNNLKNEAKIEDEDEDEDEEENEDEDD